MNIAVCDDDEVAIKEVSGIIKEICPNAKIDGFDSGKKLIKLNKCFDIIFLDVEMPEMNGLDIARYLRSKGRNDYIIFLTGHVEFMQKAFEVRAFRYINKPIDINEVKKALNDVQKEKFKNGTIIVKTHDNVVVLNIDNIVCIEAFGDGTYVYSKKDVLICKKTLKQWIADLGTNNFFHVHKSFVVSLKYIVKIEKNEIEVSYLSFPVPLSRRKRNILRTTFFEYVKNNADIM